MGLKEQVVAIVRKFVYKTNQREERAMNPTFFAEIADSFDPQVNETIDILDT